MLITVRGEHEFTPPGTPDDIWQVVVEEIADAIDGQPLSRPVTAEAMLRAANLQIYKLVPMTHDEFAQAAPGIMDLLKERAEELNS